MAYPGNSRVSPSFVYNEGGSLLTGVCCHGMLCCEPNLFRSRLRSITDQQL